MDELTEYLTTSGEDGFWEQIRSEARREAEREPLLVSFLHASVLAHQKLEDGLSLILANKLHTPDLPAVMLRDLINETFCADAAIRASIRADLLAARTRDPAARATLSRCSITKAFMRCRPTASRTPCGSATGAAWRLTCRIASPRRLASTFIRPRKSAPAC